MQDEPLESMSLALKAQMSRVPWLHSKRRPINKARKIGFCFLGGPCSSDFDSKYFRLAACGAVHAGN